MVEPSQLQTGSAEEDHLVTNAQRDLRQFAELYQRYVQPVYRYLYSRIGSEDGAEEATAQTFLSALESFGHYHHKGYFAAWLFAIARRKSADHHRRASRIADLADSLPSADEDLLQQAVRRDQLDTLRQILANLPEADQELLRLRFAASLSFAEMARLLNRSEDAVKKSLYRLLQRVQDEMEDSHD
jgi:RNA polymerase sigma-70 factor (ECF subfamily)